MPLPNLPSNFRYKYTQNPTTMDVNTFSDGNILITYYFQIADGYQHATLKLGQTSGIANLNYTTGATLWAKEIYANQGENFFLITHSYIVNDISWSLLTMDRTPDNINGIIIKIDKNGILLESFAVLNSYSPALTDQMIYINNLDVFSDSSMLILAQTTYIENQLSISSSSQLDLSIFKLNSNKDFEWGTSIDYF